MRENGDGAASMFSNRRRGIPCCVRGAVHAITVYSVVIPGERSEGREPRGRGNAKRRRRMRVSFSQAGKLHPLGSALTLALAPSHCFAMLAGNDRLAMGRCSDHVRALNPCFARNATPECVIRGLVPDRKATSMRPAATHECVLEREPESISNATGVRLAYGKIEPRTRALSDRAVPDARPPSVLRRFAPQDTSPLRRGGAPRNQAPPLQSGGRVERAKRGRRRRPR